MTLNGCCCQLDCHEYFINWTFPHNDCQDLLGSSGCHYYQLRTGNLGYKSQRLTKNCPFPTGEIEDGKNGAWSVDHYSDSRIRIWHKRHESMDLSCLVSMAQAASGDAIVRIDIFMPHFRTLSTTLALFKCPSLLEHCY